MSRREIDLLESALCSWRVQCRDRYRDGKQREMYTQFKNHMKILRGLQDSWILPDLQDS